MSIDSLRFLISRESDNHPKASQLFTRTIPLLPKR
jgi:hypothetical protein